jgi:hypothetical protein
MTLLQNALAYYFGAPSKVSLVYQIKVILSTLRNGAIFSYFLKEDQTINTNMWEENCSLLWTYF